MKPTPLGLAKANSNQRGYEKTNAKNQGEKNLDEKQAKNNPFTP
jgi:hypothetical protein